MIWLPVMFCDELDMLQVRFSEVYAWQSFKGFVPHVTHVVVEAPVTHKGVPKPLHFAESNMGEWSTMQHRVEHVITSLPDAEDPWVREHAQRDAAWPVIDSKAADDDWVLIGDLDEIPSYHLLTHLLEGTLPDPVAIRMRVFIHAVDWEVPQEYLPPQCVAATVGYIRARGGSLAAVRDARADYPAPEILGMHFSWIGTREQQVNKLDNKSCHTEILGTRDDLLIRSGEKFRTGKNAHGLPVVPVTVDGNWPAMIRYRMVPAEWFRP